MKSVASAPSASTVSPGLRAGLICARASHIAADPVFPSTDRFGIRHQPFNLGGGNCLISSFPVVAPGHLRTAQVDGFLPSPICPASGADTWKAAICCHDTRQCAYSTAAAGSATGRGISSSMRGYRSGSRGSPHGRSGVATRAGARTIRAGIPRQRCRWRSAAVAAHVSSLAKLEQDLLGGGRQVIEKPQMAA